MSDTSWGRFQSKRSPTPRRMQERGLALCDLSDAEKSTPRPHAIQHWMGDVATFHKAHEEPEPRAGRHTKLVPLHYDSVDGYLNDSANFLGPP